jgi:class 3 adenylate cyclase
MKSISEKLKLFAYVFSASILVALPPLILWYSINNAREQIFKEQLKALQKRLIRETGNFDRTVNPVMELPRNISLKISSLTEKHDKHQKILDRGQPGTYLKQYFANLSKESGFPCEVTGTFFSSKRTSFGNFNLKNDNPVKSNNLSKINILMFKLINNIYSSQEERFIKEQELQNILSSKFQTFAFSSFTRDSKMLLQSILFRQKSKVFLLITARSSNFFVISILYNITTFNEINAASIKVNELNNPSIGLAFKDFTSSKNSAVLSKRLQQRKNLFNRAVKIFRNMPDKQVQCRVDDEYFFAMPSVPQKNLRTIVSAPVPELLPLARLQLLLAIVSFLSIAIWTIIIEWLVMKRPLISSIRTIIIFLFLLVSLIPLVSSIYLSNEYLTSQFKQEVNKTIESLDQELISLDFKTLDNFRNNLSKLKSFKSVEDFQKFLALKEQNIEDLLLNTLNALTGISGHQPVVQSFIFDENENFRTIQWKFGPNKFKKEDKFDPLFANILKPKFSDYMNQSQKLKNSDTNKIKIDQLKLEIIDNLYLAIFGQKNYFDMKKNLGTLIKVETFFDKSFFISLPVYCQSEIKYIITHVIDANALRRFFPKDLLIENQNLKTLILYGSGGHFFSVSPGTLKTNEKKFPKLLQMAKASHISKTRLEKHEINASGSPIIIAQPANYSDYIIAGRKFTRSLESFRTEITSNIISATLLLTVFMLVLALFASSYFLIPINQLKTGVEEIIKKNYLIRLPDNHPDEFRNISKTFNLMTQKLHEGKLLKSFVASSLDEQIDNLENQNSALAERKEVSIIFSEIKDFKNLLQQLSPDEVHSLLQKHLEIAAQACESFSGEIDKMIEDKVMIVFNQMNSEENSAKRAMNAAKYLNSNFKSQTSETLAIGINTGIVISGIMGAESVRLSKTIVGDPVNLAARLAGVAETLPEGGLVVSKNTLKMNDYAEKTKKLAITSVKGKTQKVEIFQVI